MSNCLFEAALQAIEASCNCTPKYYVDISDGLFTDHPSIQCGPKSSRPVHLSVAALRSEQPGVDDDRENQAEVGATE